MYKVRLLLPQSLTPAKNKSTFALQMAVAQYHKASLASSHFFQSPWQSWWDSTCKQSTQLSLSYR